MSELAKPINRMSYRHVSGEVFMVWGLCQAFSTKLCGEVGEVVVLSSLSTTLTTWVPLAKFWDKHPDTGIPRFELVSPSGNKI